MIEILDKNVLIIGDPTSGKTFYSKQLAAYNKSHKLIHTDDYLRFGKENSLYVLLNNLKRIKQPTIIEGVLGYRLLRKGAEEKSYYPDIVIEIVISEELKNNRILERNIDKSKIEAQIKGNKKVLEDYKSIMNEYNPPIWITVNN